MLHYFCHAVQPNPSNALTQQTGLATSSSPGSDYGNGTQAPYSIIVSTNGYHNNFMQTYN